MAVFVAFPRGLSRSLTQILLDLLQTEIARSCEASAYANTDRDRLSRVFAIFAADICGQRSFFQQRDHGNRTYGVAVSGIRTFDGRRVTADNMLYVLKSCRENNRLQWIKSRS